MHGYKRTIKFKQAEMSENDAVSLDSVIHKSENNCYNRKISQAPFRVVWEPINNFFLMLFHQFSAKCWTVKIWPKIKQYA